MRGWLGIFTQSWSMCKNIGRWHDHELLDQLVVLFLLILMLHILMLSLLFVILGVLKMLLEVCWLVE
jgi:hypothetical protein